MGERLRELGMRVLGLSLVLRQILVLSRDWSGVLSRVLVLRWCLVLSREWRLALVLTMGLRWSWYLGRRAVGYGAARGRGGGGRVVGREGYRRGGRGGYGRVRGCIWMCVCVQIRVRGGIRGGGGGGGRGASGGNLWEVVRSWGLGYMGVGGGRKYVWDVNRVCVRVRVRVC